MAISSSSEIIKELMPDIDLIDVDTADISESGVFLLYDGDTPTDLDSITRRFAILIAGFSMNSKSGILGMLENIQTYIRNASQMDTDIEYKGTSPVVVADGGLFIYRVDIEILDTDMES